MPSFVLLRHRCPPASGVASHWDLMLQTDTGLATWRIEALPAAWQGVLAAPDLSDVLPDAQAQKSGTRAKPITGECRGWVAAVELAEHRLAYLDLEGSLSGDRGEVQRWERGDYELVDRSLERWECRLEGGHWQGRLVIERDVSAGPRQWRLRAEAETPSR
jgi:hypothetical protein